MALAQVDGWGESERLMATAVSWLINWIGTPAKAVMPSDVMHDWLIAKTEQPTQERVKLEPED